jgi:ElaB/YqjD/DUF883 family membrane-anchored ribosome-binding protein
MTTTPDLSNTMDQFRGFVGDAEKLLRATAEYSGETIATARAALQQRLEQVKGAVSDAEAAAVEGTRQAVRRAESVAGEHLWTTMAVALGVGVLIGALGARR